MGQQDREERRSGDKYCEKRRCAVGEDQDRGGRQKHPPKHCTDYEQRVILSISWVEEVRDDTLLLEASGCYCVTRIDLCVVPNATTLPLVAWLYCIVLCEGGKQGQSEFGKGCLQPIRTQQWPSWRSPWVSSTVSTCARWRRWYASLRLLRNVSLPQAR